MILFGRYLAKYLIIAVPEIVAHAKKEGYRHTPPCGRLADRNRNDFVAVTATARRGMGIGSKQKTRFLFIFFYF